MSIDRRRMELRRAQGISRRDMLSQCSTGFGLVALSGLLGGGKAFAAPPPNPFAPRVPHLPPKVKSVISASCRAVCPMSTPSIRSPA
jgi:hypothetical protein